MDNPRPAQSKCNDRSSKRNSVHTCHRILDAAYELFYRHGFARVSVDAVAERAGVTKRTLYYHFESKDAVLTRVLEKHEELARRRLAIWACDLPRDIGALVDRLFASLADWANQPRWSGAGFTRLVMELADLPGHPARIIAKRHKAAIEACLSNAFLDRNVDASSILARRVMLLMEGAITLYFVHGSTDYIDDAAQAAKQLISASTARPTAS